MRYYFIRHGESEGNVDKKAYYDSLDCDVKLTQKGRLQAIKVAHNLYDSMFSKSLSVFFSPYSRARETKNLILKECEKNSHFRIQWEIESPLLHERNWGNLREIKESSEFDESKHFNFFHRPSRGGESLMDCYQRQVLFFQTIKPKVDTDVLIVGHGEAIKCALMYLLDWTVDEFYTYENPENCQLIVVQDGELLTPLEKVI